MKIDGRRDAHPDRLALPRPGAPPNVLLIMTDDHGIGSPFVGVIPAPTLDRVASPTSECRVLGHSVR